MTTKRKPKIGECVYCGHVGPLTNDHIPPKNLFPEPRPGNLITVPSCKSCNLLASKNDKYFRNVIALREDVGDHADAKKIWPTIFRSLSKPKKMGLKMSFLRSMCMVPHKTPSGLYVGSALALNVDLDRLMSVADRITRGLYFHEVGTRLPDGYKVVVRLDEHLKCMSENGLREIAKTILHPLMSKKEKVIGDNVFSYRFVSANDRPTPSVWLLLFYGQVAFLCAVLPEAEIEKVTR